VITDLTLQILEADPVDFWIIAAMFSAGGAYGFYKAFLNLLRKRIIEDIPTSRIRSAAQGYVELEGTGKLMDGAPILAPLTGSQCTWYSYAIKERRGGRNRSWVTVESGVSNGLFLLEDDTGECVIDPEGAHVTPIETAEWYGPNRDSRPRTTGNRWFTLAGRYYFCESRMHPGDPLYALGLFETVGAGDIHDRQAEVRELLREWKQDSETLLKRFDKNGDGMVCLEEWEAVRAAAYREVMARHAELQSAPAVHTLSATHDRRRPFLLSALPQFDLVKRYNRAAIGWFLVFIIAGGMASWSIITRLTGTLL
jgi:hypothetical protein